LALAQQTAEISVEKDNSASFARYKAGETVYLKEPYFTAGAGKIVEYWYMKQNRHIDLINYKYENKLFMPAKYARYFIEITDVRCERLQDISDEDCLKEGIKGYPCSIWHEWDGKKYQTPQEAYAALINSINGKGTWESNPWVWVYDFKLVNN
jgi:hypothetical protein